MGLKKDYAELNSLGKVGAAKMAAGLLAVSATVGLSTIESIQVNEKQIVSFSDTAEVIGYVGGAALTLGGQVMLIAGFRQDQKSKEPGM